MKVNLDDVPSIFSASRGTYMWGVVKGRGGGEGTVNHGHPYQSYLYMWNLICRYNPPLNLSTISISLTNICLDPHSKIMKSLPSKTPYTNRSPSSIPRSDIHDTSHTSTAEDSVLASYLPRIEAPLSTHSPLPAPRPRHPTPHHDRDASERGSALAVPT